MTGAFYNEIDPKAAAWLRELIRQGLIAPGIVDERDIQDISPADLRGFDQCHFFAGIGVWSYALRSAGWADDRPVWTGSCPCQPFSAAGKGGGFDDERHLWPAFHYLVDQCRPDVVFGEQVASKDGLGWLDLVQADLEGTGYASGAVDLCAAGVGAPHIRQRLWWYGKRLEHAESDGRLERRAEPSGRSTTSGRSDVGLADDDDARLEGRGQPGRERSAELPAGQSGVAGGLANADGWDASAERQQPGGEQRQQPQDRGAGGMADASGPTIERQSGGVSCAEGSPDRGDHGHRASSTTGGMADASIIGRLGRRPGEAGDASGQIERPDGLRDAGSLAGHADPHGAGDEREHGLREVATHAGPVNGGWGNADWIYCRNGEWRPVEPGTFPLAHGAPARVGRLRGYGNAINAEAATAFIGSYLEARGIA